MDASEFVAWATGALAVLGILGILIRVAVKLDRVERLARELEPNGGGSIKDTVHRIERKADATSAALQRHVATPRAHRLH